MHSAHQKQAAGQRKSFLTDRFFMLLGCSQLIGIVSILFPPLFLIYLLTWPLLAIWLWLDYRSLRVTVGFWGLADIPRSPELGQKIKVSFTFVTQNPKILSLKKIFLKLPQLRCLNFVQTHLRLSPDVQTGEIHYRLELEAHTERLGYETLSQLNLECHSRSQLWLRRVVVPVEKIEFRVFPTHQKISEQAFNEISRNQNLFHQGNRKIVRSQVADQFHSIRPYQYPDPLRHIDVSKSAKYGKWMTRTYDAFLEHHLILGLDMGRSMMGRIGNSQKLDYYLAACLTLAENAFQSRDRMSFFAFSQKNHFSIRNTRHLEAWNPVFSGHPSLRAREQESNFELIHPTLSSLTGQRSLLVLLVDLSRPSIQDELLKALKPVLRKHLTVVLSLVNEDYYLDKQIHSLPTYLNGEMYNRLLYSYWLNENMRAFQYQLSAYGGGALLVPEKDWLGAVERLYSLLRVSMRI